MYMITPLFLAAVALAAPKDALRRAPMQCPSGTYKCSDDSLGWEVCNVHGEWVAAGHCDKQTSCVLHPANNIPFCQPSGAAFPTAAASSAVPTVAPSVAASTYHPTATYAKRSN